jgi:integrase
MIKLKINRVIKKYSSSEKQVILYINFGYKEFDAIRNKYSYKPLRYYPGIRIKNQDWNSELKEPSNRGQLKELLDIEKSVNDIFNYLSTSGIEITPERLKEELDVKFKGKAEVSNIVGLVDYIQEVMLKESSSRSPDTLKNFNKLANKLVKFQESNGVVLTAQNFNEQLYLEFMKDVRKGLNRLNSVWGVNKDLKAVLNEISRKYKISVFNPSKDIANIDKVSNVTEEKIYLDFERIQQIIDYQPESEKLKNVKLILMTLLFTGCRYSDVFKIIPECTYDKDGTKFRYARLISQKGSQEMVIPILDPLEKAYAENNGELPYLISDVKFNKYVKDLVEEAELTDEVRLSFTNSKGKKEFEIKNFNQFVSSHIGRRSFITNLINHIPVTILSKITGHSLTNKNVIFGYNKISLLDNAVLFVKELDRMHEIYPKDFPIRLV